MDDPPTPKIQQICFRLSVLASEITLQIDKLNKRLGVQTDDCLILEAATYNIVDRKKERERHKKSYRIELKEILDTAIDGVESL